VGFRSLQYLHAARELHQYWPSPVREHFAQIPFCLAYHRRVANSIGTAWLVLWPAYILLRMRYKLLKLSQIKLPSTHHRVLIACFSTSVLLLIVNISHAVYFFSNDETALRITGHLEVSLSLSFGELASLITTHRSLFLSFSAISWLSSPTFIAYLVTPRMSLHSPIPLGLIQGAYLKFSPDPKNKALTLAEDLTLLICTISKNSPRHLQPTSMVKNLVEDRWIMM